MKKVVFLSVVILVVQSVVSRPNKEVYQNLKFGDDTPIALNDLYMENSGGDEYIYNITEASIIGLGQPTLFQTQNLKDQVVLTYDALNITGQYWTNGTLFYLFPLFGQGNFNVEARNVTITATGEPNQYDMFFYVFDYKGFFQDYVGGGLMSLVADAIQITPITAAVVFQGFQPNIQEILNGMISNSK